MKQMETIKTAISSMVVARRNAAARLREAGNPRNPFQARSGREQQFFEAAQSIQSYDLILKLLEREAKGEMRKQVRKIVNRILAFIITSGLTILAMLGFAAAALLLKCSAPVVQTLTLLGVELSLGWAALRK